MRLVMYTLWGLYQTYPEILDNIELPKEMDKATMLDYIFMYAGENEVRYPDPTMLEHLINSWFSSRKHDFEMMWKALHAEYNPIENTDRYEDSRRTIERDSSNVVEKTSSQTTEVNGETSGEGTTTGENTRTPNLTTEETVSAFDSESYQPNSRRSESGSESNNNTETTNTSANSSQTAEQNGTENETATGKSKDAEKTTLHAHGNIGITTNQEMINEEIELRKFDIYKSIVLAFENEFTIPVYSRRCNEYGLL